MSGTRFSPARSRMSWRARDDQGIEEQASPSRVLWVASAVLCCVLGAGVACAGPPFTLETDPQTAGDETLPPSLWTRLDGEDWPSFLGPNRNGKSSETGLPTNWPPEGPRVVWTRSIGKGYGAGSISRGRYYHFDRAGDRALFCLNAETGTELWKFEYPTDFVDADGYDNGPRCSPVVDGNRVYLYGAEGMLYCLRADDGTPVWSCDTIRQFGVLRHFFGVGSTPVVEENLLIAVVGGSPPEDQNIPQGELDRVTGNGTGIVAFDKFTGEVKYTLTKELASFASPIVATIRDRRRCFAFCRGGLVAFFPDTGLINFRVPWPCVSLAAVNASTPVIVGDRVFISEAYGAGSCMISVDPGGYSISWRDRKKSRKKALQAAFNTPIYHEGYLYGCSGRYVRDMELRCVEWNDGLGRMVRANAGPVQFLVRRSISDQPGRTRQTAIHQGHTEAFRACGGIHPSRSEGTRRRPRTTPARAQTCRRRRPKSTRLRC